MRATIWAKDKKEKLRDILIRVATSPGGLIGKEELQAWLGIEYGTTRVTSAEYIADLTGARRLAWVEKDGSCKTLRLVTAAEREAPLNKPGCVTKHHPSGGVGPLGEPAPITTDDGTYRRPA